MYMILKINLLNISNTSTPGFTEIARGTNV